MSTTNQRIGQASWLFLLIALTLLLGAVVLATSDGSWLDGQQFNPLTLRQLPGPFQADDLWSDVLAPSVLAGIAILATFWLPRRPWSYGLVQSVMLLVSLRYFAWRATTLNTAHPLSLICSGLLFAVELLYLITSGLQLFPSLQFSPHLSSRQADRLEGWLESHSPSVDIWIPTYNEPARLVRRAILSCRNLRHSALTVTVLDDGHRSEIRSLAHELGVNYLSRDGNEHRKAGNLNYALAHTKAEFIAVFDCDFMPFAGFLERTLGFFADASVALVQTPQHYFQAEFHNRNLGLDVVMPSDLDYFFRYLQVVRDRSNAVICCGTSYVVRRSALESIGGYVTSCLIEDHQTSTKLLTRGWTIRYLNEVLSMGEVPRSFADFLDQRLRWMQGNIQIFFRPKELPIWSNLRPAQLAFYVNLAISLLTPLWRILYLLLPLLSLILGFTLIAAPPIEYVSYGLPFVLLLHALPSWLSDYHQYQFWNEVYETLFCFPGLKRMLQVLCHPFMIYGGIVTRKDSGALQQRFNLGLIWPIALLLAVLALAIPFRFVVPIALGNWNAWRPTYEGESLMLSWNIYNGIVLVVTLLACIDQPIRRATDRFPIRRIGRVLVDGRELWGTTVDISEEGAAFALQQPSSCLQSGEVILELMEPPLRLPARLVRVQGQNLALQFHCNDAAIDAALISLIYDGSHWFHRPRRLHTIDAFLRWIGTLIRPDPILRRFSG